MANKSLDKKIKCRRILEVVSLESALVRLCSDAGLDLHELRTRDYLNRESYAWVK